MAPIGWWAGLNLFLLTALVSADCPPRSRESWEHNERTLALAGYDKFSLRCPTVNIALYPGSIQVDRDLGFSSMEVGIHLVWTDPHLVVESTNALIKVNSSEIWTPKMISLNQGDSTLTPSALTSEYMDASTATGAVSSFFITTIQGLCYATPAGGWPRDKLYCNFILQPASNEEFNLTQDSRKFSDNVEELQGMMQRMSAWRLLSLQSDIFAGATVLVQAELQRLPSQLEAEVVQPCALVAALVPASVALPPWCAERPALLVTSVVLHAKLMLSLPTLARDLPGDLPRNLLLFRDSALLLLVVVLQWLLSSRLASRRRPLCRCLQSVARALSRLRRPLLLPYIPAAPSLPKGSPPRCPRDEQSVGMAEVLDRLTFVAVSACYLAAVTVGTQ